MAIILCDTEDYWINALEDIDMNIPGVQRFADYVTELWVEETTPRGIMLRVGTPR